MWPVEIWTWDMIHCPYKLFCFLSIIIEPTCIVTTYPLHTGWNIRITTSYMNRQDKGLFRVLTCGSTRQREVFHKRDIHVHDYLWILKFLETPTPVFYQILAFGTCSTTLDKSETFSLDVLDWPLFNGTFVLPSLLKLKPSCHKWYQICAMIIINSQYQSNW